MLIRFSIENFRSIKNKINLDLIPSPSEEHIEDLINTGEESVELLSKVAVLYGANASGKSNILLGFGFMRFLLQSSHILSQNSKLNYQPFSFIEEKNMPTSFELYFILDGIRYLYGFSYDSEKILEEYLHFYPKGKSTIIFTRTNNEYDFGSFKSKLEKYKESTTSNRFFLSMASFLNDRTLSPIFNYIQNIKYENDLKGALVETAEKLSGNDEFKLKFISILKKMDIDYLDIYSSVKKEIVHDNNISEALKKLSSLGGSNPGELIKDIIQEKIEIDIINTYPNNYKMPLKQESDGVQKLFEILLPILELLENGGVLVLDELERSLHPLLSLKIVNLFIKENPKNAQLIFSTHDSNLLDLSLFRRDQIWFTEKDKDYSTDLYSLYDIKNVRKDENVRKGYLQGKYGAIPLMSGDL